MCNAARITRPRNVTELTNDGMIKFVDVHYQTEPKLSVFSEGDLIMFLFAYSFSN